MWRNKDISNLSPDLQFALRHSLDQGSYPDVFPIDYGMDFDNKDDPEYDVMPYHNQRRVTISITSFIGSCAWAQHYYADIEADGVELCKKWKREDGHEMTTWKSPKIPDGFSYKEKAKYGSCYKIEVCREVTAQMIYDEPSIWEGYDAGDPTNRFDSAHDALEIAKKIVEARFPGWEIKIENY